MPRRTWSSRLLDVSAKVVPGIGRVRAQKEPFALAWAAANRVALESGRPLWVALGDSMTQGIGAHDVDGGWVPRLNARLGEPFAVVNLSASGARVQDVLDDQLPRLPATPALVTVLVGANDMLTRGRRRDVPARFEALLDRLPPGRSVVATLPQGNTQALAVNALLDRAGAAGRIDVADLRGPALGPLRGSLADDWFHPNDVGYERMAGLFEGPVRACLARYPGSRS
ncbi:MULTISPECIES: SGNH/GDSL hydrolase family protein [unclassified Amycolatopsis]|uniref:SGNH/GDSL hydrolase family protein n=1 Tax=unclassified Amycolatopsis TaxID=2618356 RepID=UPI002E0D2085|nr:MULTISPECIES: SGNH/GDSL hydrolase family protein [unclassified Amycolatopsis]WSK77173.1 SGNH/GDSL hydrolase family protein [Amycolatopsis sp. NBC_01286]